MFIVIEVHGGPEYATICMDSWGSNIVFDTREEAEEFAKEECQDGIVVGI